MWALRGATNPLKGRTFIMRTLHKSYPNPQVANRTLDKKAENGYSHMLISVRCTCLKSSHCFIRRFTKSSQGWCGFSSQADLNNSVNEDDDLEDGFSELEDAPTESENEIQSENKNENESRNKSNNDQELSKEEENNLYEDMKEPQEDETLNCNSKKNVSLGLFYAIVDASSGSIQSALDKWVEDGNELNESLISVTMFNLKVRNMYSRALQFSDWMESRNHFELGEKNYATHVDLIAKVRGIDAAETFINKIPKSFKNELIYKTFLVNCVNAYNKKKAEQIFNKLREFEDGLSSFSCNQMLVLYKKTDKKKVADVLLLMEKEKVNPNLFTYRILIDMKGESNDISGMEQIIEAMKAEGVEPDLHIQATLARHYVNLCYKQKAESVLREMEGDDLRERKQVCNVLLPLYASLGKANEVERVWQACEPNPRLEDCIAATIAWGKLGNVEKAEEAFERMMKITKKPSPKHYSPLLRIYAIHKMVKKGKDLVTRMADRGTVVGPDTWDDLVRLYVYSGEVEKADSILQKATQQSQMRPLISSFMILMCRYAEKGDVHNTEKIFHKMRQAGYSFQHKQFEPLIRAYVNANVPVYGLRERMKADNVILHSSFANMLDKVDPFRKTSVSALLD